MTRIEVDFNSRDERGYLAALSTDADSPVVPGEQVEAYDDEGNRCVARVAFVDPPRIALDPQWRTFASPDEASVFPTAVSPAGGTVGWTSPTTLSFIPYGS